MKAYSPDLRERILRALEGGMSTSEAARVFDVGISTVKRYVRQQQETGSLTPKPIPGRPARIGARACLVVCASGAGDFPWSSRRHHLRIQ